MREAAAPGQGPQRLSPPPCSSFIPLLAGGTEGGATLPKSTTPNRCPSAVNVTRKPSASSGAMVSNWSICSATRCRAIGSRVASAKRATAGSRAHIKLVGRTVQGSPVVGLDQGPLPQGGTDRLDEKFGRHRATEELRFDRLLDCAQGGGSATVVLQCCNDRLRRQMNLRDRAEADPIGRSRVARADALLMPQRPPAQDLAVR